MEILEISKLNQAATIKLDATDLLYLKNAVYEYRKKDRYLNTEEKNKLYARLILACDMVQYGIINGFNLRRILEITNSVEDLSQWIESLKEDE